jgi:hypothetical protein
LRRIYTGYARLTIALYTATQMPLVVVMKYVQKINMKSIFLEICMIYSMYSTNKHHEKNLPCAIKSCHKPLEKKQKKTLKKYLK